MTRSPWLTALTALALAAALAAVLAQRIQPDVTVNAGAFVRPVANEQPATTTTTTTTTTAKPATKAVALDRGALWDRLAQCESGGNWAIDAFHDGGLQFAVQTWASYAPADFPPYAHQATREQQIFVAERVLRDQGWNAWPTCARKLGLIA